MRHQNVHKLIKLFKDIDLIKAIINKKSYVFCAIKKAQRTLYKSYIHPEKRLLNLIHNNICDFIILRDRFNDKYFIIFIND